MINFRSGRFRKDSVAKNRNSLTFIRSKGDVVELRVYPNDKDEGLMTRAISICHNEEKSYKWYATSFNCPIELISDLYKLRWQIEFAFNNTLKSHFYFGRVRTSNPNTKQVLCMVFIYNCIITLSIRQIGFDAQQTSKSESPQTNSDQPHSRHSNPSKTPKRSLSILRAAPIMSLLLYGFYLLMRVNTRITKKKLYELSREILSQTRSYLDPGDHKRNTTMIRL